MGTSHLWVLLVTQRSSYGQGDGTVPARLWPGRLMGADVQAAARMRLGARLRSLREGAGITGGRAAGAIGSSVTKVSRIEAGRGPARLADVVALLDLYRVSDAGERDALLAVAREAGQPGWWDQFANQVPAHVRHDLSLEAAAAVIAVYDGQAVPALLQTPAYARSVCAADPGSTWRAGLGPTALAHRRALLDTPGGPRLWALIGAAALHKAPAGDAGVLGEQAEHLMSGARRPGVTIQIVPENAPSELSAAGPFALLRFAEHDLPDAVLLEQLTTTALLRPDARGTGRLDVERYWEIFYMIARSAYTPGESSLALPEIARRPGGRLP
jgi:transcriptional regulator with XRE-family HTH domain